MFNLKLISGKLYRIRSLVLAEDNHDRSGVYLSGGDIVIFLSSEDNRDYSVYNFLYGKKEINIVVPPRSELDHYIVERIE